MSTAAATLFAGDEEVLDFPKTVTIAQARTGSVVSYPYTQTGAVSTREAGASQGKYRVGDRKFYLPIDRAEVSAGAVFEPGSGDSITDELGAVFAVIDVKTTETSRSYICYARRPTIPANTADKVDIEKMLPVQTDTGGVSYNYVPVYSQVTAALVPLGGLREWTNGREHITVTHRLTLESPLALDESFVVHAGAKRYRILSAAPEAPGSMQQYDVSEIGA